MDFLDINILLISLVNSLYSFIPSSTHLVMLCFTAYYTILFFYTHFHARKQATTLPVPSSLPVEVLAWLRSDSSLMKFLVFDLVWHGHLSFKDFKMPNNQTTLSTPLDPLRARIKAILQDKPLESKTLKLLPVDREVQFQLEQLEEQMRKMEFVRSHSTQAVLKALSKSQRIFLVLSLITLPAFNLGFSDPIGETIRYYYFSDTYISSLLNFLFNFLLIIPFLLGINGIPMVIANLKTPFGESALKEFKQRYEKERSYYTKNLSLPADTNVTFVFLVGLYGLSFIDDSYSKAPSFTFFNDFVKEFSGSDRYGCSDCSWDDI